MVEKPRIRSVFEIDRLWVLLFIYVFTIAMAHAQVERIEPPNWWVGFEDKNLQILLQGQDLGSYTVTLDHPSVVLKAVNRADSPNYLFLDLYIPENTTPGTLYFELNRENETTVQLSYRNFTRVLAVKTSFT